MNSSFENKAVIVTGASSGFGRAISVRLAKSGAEVWLVGRSEKGLQETVDLIAEAGGPTPHAVSLDLTQSGALSDLVTQVGEQHPHLFALINNAGVMFIEPTISAELERWKELMAVNLITPMEASQAAVAAMRKHKLPGHIINISSIAGQTDIYGVYGVSKAAINHLGKTMRKELEGDDIRVTTIIPGGFATNITQGYRPEDLAAFAKVAEQKGVDLMGPDGRKYMGDPEYIAEAIHYVLQHPIELNIESMTIRPAISIDID